MSRLNQMNTFNAHKLLLSKWTAVTPLNKQKHFLVTKLVRDEWEQTVVACMLEAVIDKQLFEIDWRELKDADRWIQGWK